MITDIRTGKRPKAGAKLHRENCSHCSSASSKPCPLHDKIKPKPLSKKYLPPCLKSMGCMCAGHARGNPASAACDTTEPDTSTVCCTQCGGTNVQHAVWMSSNTGETHDEFGTWNQGDNTFCADCDGCTDLVSKGAEPKLFAECRAKFLNKSEEG